MLDALDWDHTPDNVVFCGTNDFVLEIDNELPGNPMVSGSILSIILRVLTSTILLTVHSSGPDPSYSPDKAETEGNRKNRESIMGKRGFM